MRRRTPVWLASNKDLLGQQDIAFDSNGVAETFARMLSNGGTQNIKKINASHLPLLLATRTLALYNGGSLNAEQADAAFTQICASLAGIHKFSNEESLLTRPKKPPFLLDPLDNLSG